MVACLLFNFKMWTEIQSHVQFPKSLTLINELCILSEFPDYLCLSLEVTDKIPIWQVAVNLESANIVTGYGFGKNFKEAKAAALGVLFRRVNNQR